MEKDMVDINSCGLLRNNPSALPLLSAHTNAQRPRETGVKAVRSLLNLTDRQTGNACIGRLFLHFMFC